MTDIIALRCLFQGENPDRHVFEIKADKTKSVVQLKKLIKEKERDLFASIDANVLLPIKVNVPLDEPNEKLDRLRCRLYNCEAELDGVAMSQFKLVGEYFPNEPEQTHIHLIIQWPHDSE